MNLALHLIASVVRVLDREPNRLLNYTILCKSHTELKQPCCSHLYTYFASVVVLLDQTSYLNQIRPIGLFVASFS
jgi:hypothetical protein